MSGQVSPDDLKRARLTDRSYVRGRVLPTLVGMAVVLSTVPLFFSYYRTAAFHSVPFDDYAPSLLALTGQNGTPPNRIPTLLQTAPIGYRILSVAAAIPLYYVLPYYAFSELQNPDEPYLRAEAAISMVSYLSVLLTVLMIFRIARRRLHCSFPASLLAGLFSLGLFLFMGTSSVDPLAVLIISVLVYFIERPVIFAPVMVLSAAMNEKVFIVFAIVFAGRVVVWLWRRTEPFKYWVQAAATGVAALVYAVMRLVLRRPGYENQTDPGTWLAGAASTIESSLSLKGLIQNGIPLAILAILMLVAYAVWASRRRMWAFSPLDLAVGPVLVGIGFAINMQVTVGHLALHSFPLYLPLLAFLIDDPWTVRLRKPRASVIPASAPETRLRWASDPEGDNGSRDAGGPPLLGAP